MTNPKPRPPPQHMTGAASFEPPHGWWDKAENVHHEEDEDEDEMEVAGGLDKSERSMFCSRRHALNAGVTLREWNAQRGEEAHRLSYEADLAGGGMLVDFGGYRGAWAAAMMDRCHECTVHVYEPVREYVDASRRRLDAFFGASVHHAAIGAAQGEAKVAVRGAGSKLDAEGNEMTIVEVSRCKCPKEAPTLACAERLCILWCAVGRGCAQGSRRGRRGRHQDQRGGIRVRDPRVARGEGASSDADKRPDSVS